MEHHVDCSNDSSLLPIQEIKCEPLDVEDEDVSVIDEMKSNEPFPHCPRVESVYVKEEVSQEWELENGEETPYTEKAPQPLCYMCCTPSSMSENQQVHIQNHVNEIRLHPGASEDPLILNCTRTCVQPDRDIQLLFHNNVKKPEAIYYDYDRYNYGNSPQIFRKWNTSDWNPAPSPKNNTTQSGRGSRQSSSKIVRREHESEEEYNQRISKCRFRYLKWLGNETETRREERLKKMRDRERRRRSNETEEERAERLRKLRTKQAQRLANETPEKRAHRLKRMRITSAERLANETPEQRENRLTRMRIRAAERLASETPEQRAYRLKTSSFPILDIPSE